MSNTQANDTLNAMLDQYENSSKSRNNTAKEYDLKNYFTTHLGDDQKSANKRLRILPTPDGSSPFKEVYGHKVQVEGQWKTFTCLKHEMNTDCPFCEANDLLRAEGEGQKENAKRYSARKMYVVKVIDRDNLDHGVKFWRFNHDYRKQGILDKIYGVLQAVNKDVSDPETGRDLLVMITRDQNNKPAVTTIAPMDSTPLTTDAAQKAAWLGDTRTWKDVYAIKSYDYLAIIVGGGVPAWDKEAKTFVDKAKMQEKEKKDVAEEYTLGTPNVKEGIKASTKAPLPVVEGNTGDEDDSDLPF